MACCEARSHMPQWRHISTCHTTQFALTSLEKRQQMVKIKCFIRFQFQIQFRFGALGFVLGLVGAHFSPPLLLFVVTSVVVVLVVVGLSVLAFSVSVTVTVSVAGF